ncbi:hypothetical protein [Arthrobacter sp. PsM3]|uniref:hypothetical protein n=1 Tax=Arthrobacter sp. PsM3 TaxID=3030531 RepID=UPI00263B551F|nr:hypothetical protein [Arthrobacter sp. PsM3]MDN4644189.1 hypothetical protein [Arthrobacter sp. PsM3]
MVEPKDVALFAAVFAALVTSLFNLRVASDQRKTQNRHWLLGRKQEAYVRFLDARREMINLAKREPDPAKLLKGRKKLLGDLRPTAIMLLGPADISKAAEDIYDETKKLINPDEVVIWNPEMEAAVAQIHEDTKVLRHMMKEDIRADLELDQNRPGFRNWSGRNL